MLCFCLCPVSSGLRDDWYDCCFLCCVCCCWEQIKEESDKLKHGGEKKSALEVAFGAPRKNLLDDLLGVQVGHRAGRQADKQADRGRPSRQASRKRGRQAERGLWFRGEACGRCTQAVGSVRT